MSLNVPATLIASAQNGIVDSIAFIACLKESLPAAWRIFEMLNDALMTKTEGFAIYAPDHMADADRGQLLRALASNAIRGAVERHFGFVLAFQNCHKAGAIRPHEVGSAAWKAFTSVEEQILQQQPQFRDC